MGRFGQLPASSFLSFGNEAVECRRVYLERAGFTKRASLGQRGAPTEPPTRSFGRQVLVDCEIAGYNWYPAVVWNDDRLT
jgi:hypothetical protein